MVNCNKLLISYLLDLNTESVDNNNNNNNNSSVKNIVKKKNNGIETVLSKNITAISSFPYSENSWELLLNIPHFLIYVLKKDPSLDFKNITLVSRKWNQIYKNPAFMLKCSPAAKVHKTLRENILKIDLPYSEKSWQSLFNTPNFLINIFKEIPLLDLKRSVSRVSKHWNQACKNPALELRRWHTLVERIMPKAPYTISLEKEDNILLMARHYIKFQGLAQSIEFIQEKFIEDSYGYYTRTAKINTKTEEFRFKIEDVDYDILVFEDFNKQKKTARYGRMELAKQRIIIIHNPDLPAHILKLIKETSEYVNAVFEKRKIAVEEKKQQYKRKPKDKNTSNKESKI